MHKERSCCCKKSLAQASKLLMIINKAFFYLKMNDFYCSCILFLPAWLPCNPIQPHTQICITSIARAFLDTFFFVTIDCYKMTMKSIFMIINKNHFYLLLCSGLEYRHWKRETKKKKSLFRVPFSCNS